MAHPGTNLFYWNRMDFLVVGDYFTKFLIMRKIPNTSTHALIKELAMIFTEFGCPFVLKSNNGLCYSSREFHNFLKFYQIHHITSSPYHLQSNRFAEALVGILKKIMEKSIKDGKNMELWTTPIQSDTHIEHHSITIGSPHRQETEDFTSLDPFQHWEVCKIPESIRN